MLLAIAGDLATDWRSLANGDPLASLLVASLAWLAPWPVRRE